jgi:hypothetical protein
MFAYFLNLFLGPTLVSRDLTNNALFVDGKPHGMLHKGDAIAIENGKLLINSKEVVEIAGK